MKFPDKDTIADKFEDLSAQDIDKLFAAVEVVFNNKSCTRFNGRLSV